MKLLITAPTFTPSLDGPQFLPADTFVEVDADAGRKLCEAGKALYMSAKDDPTTKGNAAGAFTATAEQVAAAEAQAKASAEAAKPAKVDKPA